MVIIPSEATARPERSRGDLPASLAGRV